MEAILPKVVGRGGHRSHTHEPASAADTPGVATRLTELPHERQLEHLRQRPLGLDDRVIETKS